MRRWTAAEDQILIRTWCEFSIATIAKRLDRSMSAVRTRVSLLNLCGERHGLMTVNQIAKKSGFSHSSVKLAIRTLGVQLVPIPAQCERTVVRRRRSGGSQMGAEEADVDRIIDYLLQHKGCELYPREDLKRTTKGRWIFSHGPCCMVCGTNTEPHYARCMCRRCNVNFRRGMIKMDKNKDVDVLIGGKADEPRTKCPGCGATPRLLDYDDFPAAHRADVQKARGEGADFYQCTGCSKRYAVMRSRTQSKQPTQPTQPTTPGESRKRRRAVAADVKRAIRKNKRIAAREGHPVPSEQPPKDADVIDLDAQRRARNAAKRARKKVAS